MARETDAAGRELAPRPFTGVLQEQRKGGLHQELSAGLQELVAQVLQTGRQGTLTMKIKVKPAGDGVVAVSDDVVVNIPRPERSPTIFFAEPTGNLSRNDPRQSEIEMPITVIDGGREAASA